MPGERIKTMISLNAQGKAVLAFALALGISPLCAGAEEAAVQDAQLHSVLPQPQIVRESPERSQQPADGGLWGPGGPPESSHVEEAAYGMPMPWGQTQFEAYRQSYLTSDGREWLAAMLARARPYLPYIEERIRYYGLPDELAFLPVIESEFTSRNISRSGATGLWQFMRNSVAGYGMKIDEWVDERRDFMKSTEGALRKLADNYATFADWNLALAAYNCGDGAIARALVRARRAGVQNPDYWELRKDGYLRSETAAYVPKFLAVASLLRYPGRNGIQADWNEAIAWETVVPGRPVDIKLIADEAGIPFTTLRDANPELRYTITPPSETYALKVPASAADSIRAIVSDKSKKLIRYYLHTVHSGDTLTQIAQRYGTPLQTIVSSNPGLHPDRIGIGQVLVVPALKDGPAPEAPKAEDEAAPDFTGSYTVAKGDTLWNIALHFDVAPETLADRNGLALGTTLHEGMTIKVPEKKTP